MRCHTTSFCSSLIATQCATSTTVRPQPRHTSSTVVEQTATQGVSGRTDSGAALASRADIELVPAFVAELFHGLDILFEDLGRVRERVDRAFDAVLSQQVQD